MGASDRASLLQFGSKRYLFLSVGFCLFLKLGFEGCLQSVTTNLTCPVSVQMFPVLERP